MKIIQHLLPPAFRRAKRHFTAVFAGILLLVSQSVLLGQKTPLSKAVLADIAQIAQHMNSGFDEVTHALEQVGYHPPEHLKSEWNKWPVIARITQAFQAADNVSTENSARFLALMKQNQAQQYDPEPKPVAYNAEVLSFKHSEMTMDVKIDPEVKVAIKTLSDHFEGNGLGSVHRLLTEHCQLTADEGFHLLATSQSHTEALEKAVSKLDRKVFQKVALKGIATEVCTQYPAAAASPEMRKILGWDVPAKIPTPKLVSNTGHNLAAVGVGVNVEKTENTVKLTFSEATGAVNLSVDPSAVSKLNSSFFRDFEAKVGRMTRPEEVAGIENDLRQVLLATVAPPVRSATDVFNGKQKP